MAGSNDGKITVRRYKAGADPDKTQMIYESMDQLRQAGIEDMGLITERRTQTQGGE